MSHQAGNGHVVIRCFLIEAPDFMTVVAEALPGDASPLLLLVEPSSDSVTQHLQWLTAEEQLRAKRLKNIDQQRLWIKTHAILQQQLASLTGIFPDHQPYTLRPGGKPVLSRPAGLCFNLADTDGSAVLAFHTAPVGIDVERVSRLFDFQPVVRRYFSPVELGWLEGRQAGDFFLLWTRKEAVLKLTGAGLTDQLGEFDVSAFEWRGKGSVMFPEDEPMRDIWVYSFFRGEYVFSVALYHQVEKWEALRLKVH